MRPPTRIIGFALALTVAACSHPPVGRGDSSLTAPSALAPQWVRQGLSSQHPDALWLQAVGSAELGASVQDARERAEFKARAGLVRNLSSSVRSASEMRELFEAVNDRSRLQINLDETIHIVGQGTLEGARPLEFFVDERNLTAYCLLVLERAPAAREVARRVAEKEGEAAALLAHGRDGPPGPALLALCVAYDCVVAARVLRASYLVLAGGPITQRDAVGDDVLASLRALASSWSLHLESGQGQTGRVGDQLAVPIVFQLRGPDGRGVDGVELQFDLLGRAKAELSASKLATVAGGAAALAVRAIGASGQRSNQIECRVAALEQRGFVGPRAVAEYLLPAAADTRVLLGSKTTIHGEPAAAATMHAGVLTALGAASFAVVAPSTVADEVSATDVCDLPVVEVCQRLRGRVDWIVRVDGSARAASARGDRMRARASAAVELVEVATGQIDRFTSDPIDGLGDTHELAAASGLERLGAALGGTVVTRLRARIGL